jgi:hypothetical protein
MTMIFTQRRQERKEIQEALSPLRTLREITLAPFHFWHSNGYNIFIGNCDSMNLSRVLIVALLAGITLQCKHHQIVLENVSDLPEYFFEGYHFGSDLRSIAELNEFILVTGKIDTTSESPPLRLAVIAIDHKKIFLRLARTKTINEETTEKYSGDGYVLNLTYKEKHIQNHSPIYEGYFVIEQDDNRSQYEVVGTSGYY